MPEIKKNFTSGKMNKDLDERLVPNGEYRHAMNIQVSTSEESDVGAVQNVAGTGFINPGGVQANLLPSTAGNKCVGSIADEKTNSIYWFVTQGVLELWVEDGDNAISVQEHPDWGIDDGYNFGELGLGSYTNFQNLLINNDGWWRIINKDKIIRYHHPTSDPEWNPSIVPVFIDNSSIVTTIVTWDEENEILIPQQNMAEELFDQSASYPTYYPETQLTSEIGSAVVSYIGYDPGEADMFELYDITGIEVGAKIKGWGVHEESGLPHNFYPEDMVVTEIARYGPIWIDINGVKRQQGIIKANYNFYDNWMNPPSGAPIPEWFLPNLVTHLEFSSGVLNFSKENLITAINIVDDMLFWSDGITEPKKINITRSIEGTDPSGDKNTVIVNNSRGYGLDSFGMDEYPVKEENITVIKKGPKKAPEMQLYSENIDPLQGLSTMQFVIDSNTVSSGDTLNMLLEDIIGDFNDLTPGVLLSVFDPSNPIEELAVLEIIEINPNDVGTNYDLNSTYSSNALVSLSALNVGWGTQDATFPHDKILVVRVNSISTTISSGTVEYSIKIKEEENLLFNLKFPRFATRWRYEDGEYSTFSPFTRIAFIPSTFSFHPKEAYNLGMVNKVSKVVLRDLVPVDLPKDVTEIEILYKDEDSPVIYSLQIIKNQDKAAPNEDYNIWNTGANDGMYNGKGTLTITSENITYALPENQLLRPYDNIPRLAKSQEIVGSRLIYGNYLQNYNVDANRYNIYSGLVSYIENNKTPFFQKDSIKSLRQYQLGVVFMDKYGRQSPIISNNTSEISVGQERCDRLNQITASIKNTAPDWASHFKFYIKENNFGNNNDYYNLSLDRAYDAEDGNVWLSFPSSDRNKVTEESFLTLKKQHGTNNPNYDSTKYKIISIENEAPEFIKYKWSIFGSTSQNVTNTLLFSDEVVNAGMAPGEGYSTIAMNLANWSLTPSNPDFEDMLEFVGNGDLAIRFTGLSTLVSHQYVVRTVSEETINTENLLIFKLDKTIEDSDSWVYDPTQSTTPYDTDGFPNDLDIIIYKRELREYPEFDGRFFAKIARNTIISQFISSALGVQSQRVVGTVLEAFYLSDDNGYNNSSVVGSGLGTTGYSKSYPFADNNDWDISNTNTSADSRFINNFKFDGSQPKSAWFIDSMYFRNRVRSNSGSDYEESAQNWPGSPWASEGAPSKIGQGGFGRGIYTSGGQAYMTLSFGKIDPDGASWTWNRGDHGTEFQIGEDANPAHAAEARIVSRFTAGQEFQFKDDIVAGAVNPYYKITGPPQKLNVFNHTNWDDIYDNLWVSNPVQVWGWGPDDQWIWDAGWEDIGYWELISEDNCFYDGSDTDKWDCMKKTARASRQALEASHNRRVIYTIPINARPGIDPTFATDDWTDPLQDVAYATTSKTNPTQVAGKDTSVTIEFLDEFQEGGTVLQSMNPAVFETEPSKSPDIDIYYEASKSYPTRLTGTGLQEIINIGDIVESVSIPNFFPANTKVTKLYFETDYSSTNFNNPVIVLDQLNNTSSASGVHVFRFTNTNSGAFVELKMSTYSSLQDSNGYHYTVAQYKNSAKNMTFGLDWYNCYSFGNGVESNRIRDDFNQIKINNGVKVSSIAKEDQYKEEHKKNSLIFSGLYNSTGGVNNLNQFIQAEKITKDLNPVYGSIQKLHTRDTDLIALCEDRVLKILANKDAVFNADGKPQLTANERVLGQSVPFNGDYGISKNPESFASDAYRSYFSDKQRGTVMRLSRDGLTPISEYGMVGWFNDNLRHGDHIIGTFDTKKREYNITIKDLPTQDYGTITENSGCMDPVGINYDPLAIYHGPCEWPDWVGGCTDNPDHSTTNQTINGDVVVINGEDQTGPFNYNPNANADCNTIPYWSQNTYDPDASGTWNDCCCYDGGCLDPCGIEYDENYCYFSPGSCTYPTQPYCNPTQDQIDFLLNDSGDYYYDFQGNQFTTSTGTGLGLGCVAGCSTTSPF